VKNETREWVLERCDPAVFYEGVYLDGAVIGVAERCGQPALVVYDYDRLVRAFVEQVMTEEEASKMVDFNYSGAWIGPNTPLIIHRLRRSSKRKRSVNEEIERLRKALQHIAEMRDEPFCPDFARDVLKGGA